MEVLRRERNYRCPTQGWKCNTVVTFGPIGPLCMPKADVSEERIVIGKCGQRSTDWWNTLLDKLKAHHIPGRYQDGKRMWADSRGNAIIYFTSDTVSPDNADKLLEECGFDVRHG